MPDVIEIRRKIYPNRHDYQLIGSSVSDPHWLDQISGNRPVLVVAEGLVQYLSEKEVVELFNRITEKFTHGDIIFDVYSSLMTWAMNLALSRKKAGVSLHWSMDEPHKLEKQVSHLKLIDTVTFLTMPELVERMSKSSQYQRIMGGILTHIGFYKRMVRHLRYRF